MAFTYKDLIILYEDNHILVVVKPFNLPVQADSSGDTDMLTLLKQYLVETYHKEGEAYLGLVHRLDRVTGGVMVFAKTSKAASRLCEALKKGDFEKKYFAVVRGDVEKSDERLVHYLKKYESKNIVSVVPQTETDAKRAELEYRMLEGKEGTTLVSVDLMTGRSHQIRVQMSTIGHSLVGDQKYGKPMDGEPRCQLALWAYELKFTHPTTQKRMCFRVGVASNAYPWNLYNMEMYINLSVKE